MPIIRTIPTSNFTVLNNAIANDATVSATASAALLYLISKPPHWKFNAYDLKRRLNVGLNKVYRVMRELIRAGYATYQRIQSGTIWNIYDTPQNIETAIPPVESHRVNFEHIQNECVLERTEKSVIIEKQQPGPIPEPQKPVVVSLDDKENLIYPVQLDTDQKKQAKRIIRKLKQPELSQDVLFELAYIITSGKLKTTIPRCLGGLVSIANEQGYFTRTQAGSATMPDTKRIDATQAILDAYREPPKISQEKRESFLQQAKSALRGAL